MTSFYVWYLSALNFSIVSFSIMYLKLLIVFIMNCVSSMDGGGGGGVVRGFGLNNLRTHILPWDMLDCKIEW